jgi:hypothetical protein
MKEMDEFGAIYPLRLDTWKKHRDDLERLGGPPDRPAAPTKTISAAR